MILPRSFDWRRMAVLALCVLASGAAFPVSAVPVGLGDFSLVTYAPGTTAFEIDNLTGADALPDYGFPVETDITFTSLTLTYWVGGILEAASVPDVVPGTTYAVLLPDSTSIDSASLSGLLTPSTFQLSDGSLWQFSTDILSVALEPSSGPELTVDVDSNLIAADASSPEPATAVLVLAGLGLAGLLRRRY